MHHNFRFVFRPGDWIQETFSDWILNGLELAYEQVRIKLEKMPSPINRPDLRALAAAPGIVEAIIAKNPPGSFSDEGSFLRAVETRSHEWVAWHLCPGRYATWIKTAKKVVTDLLQRFFEFNPHELKPRDLDLTADVLIDFVLLRHVPSDFKIEVEFCERANSNAAEWLTWFNEDHADWLNIALGAGILVARNFGLRGPCVKQTALVARWKIILKHVPGDFVQGCLPADLERNRVISRKKFCSAVRGAALRLARDYDDDADAPNIFPEGFDPGLIPEGGGNRGALGGLVPKDLRDKLRACMETLCACCREILDLRYWKGHRLVDIGKAMAENTVWNCPPPPEFNGTPPPPYNYWAGYANNRITNCRHQLFLLMGGQIDAE